ncbi:hypothetical protein DPMN_015581 [Dreissena polymorpha]|uniref:BEN domain-containing protein n=2 Tax=Dreissena polymorpha TaxID=45954 RepID=A0A9D4S3R6_DREPO|nr:hypothetical protein DPMN_015581 [Dreissena polymorpha]
MSGGTFIHSMGPTSEQVVPPPLPVGATYVPPPVEETVVGEVLGPWMSLLAEPLSVTPTGAAVSLDLSTTPTPTRTSFLATRPTQTGSMMSILNQMIEMQKTDLRDQEKLRRQVEFLTRGYATLLQEMASMKDLMSSIVMGLYNYSVTSTTQPTVAQPTIVQPTVAQPIAAQATNAQPTYVQPTYVHPTYAQPTASQPTYPPRPESEAIAGHALLSDEEVRMIRQASHGPGNFAARLTKRLYPELFTAANVRLHYNYHGGGRDKKQALSPRRKVAIRTYVIRHFPSMSDEQNWGHEGIVKMNELLRRPAREPAAMTNEIDM